MDNDTTLESSYVGYYSMKFEAQMIAKTGVLHERMNCF